MLKAVAFRRSLVMGIMVLLIGVFIIPSDALADFEDGDFLNWSDTYIATPGCSAYMTRYETGGNPDAHVTSTTISGSGTVWHLMVNNDAEWNPAIEGPIEHVTFRIDVKSVSGWGNGQNLKILVFQNGQYFLAPGSQSNTGSSTSWHTMTLGGFQASDFFLKNTAQGGDPTIHPDFSESGTSIKFGFATGNSNSGTYTQRYDNWHVYIGVNQPPTAVIDTILPKNTEEDFPILFRGHGQDQDGSIISWEWKRWDDVVFGSQPEFVTTLPQSPEIGNTISFKVQDDDGAWSDAVTQSVTVLPAGTLLRNWDFPPDEPLYMGRWYDIVFSTHNQSMEHPFDVLYGLQYYYSPSVPGFQHLAKLHVYHLPRKPLSSNDYGDYTWGDTVLYSLPPSGIAGHLFGVRTHWDWIAPWGLQNVLSAILNFLPGVGQTSSLFGDLVKWFSEGAGNVSKLLSLLGQIRTATGYMLNSDTYVTYEGLCNSAPETPRQLHYVVPIDKINLWVTYVGVSFAAGRITMIPLPFGLNYIIQVGMLIGDQFVYQAAYDPDSNFTELVIPQFYFPPQLDSIPNETARAAAYEVFRGVAYAEALKKSYAKYQGALLDENEEWAAKQLSSVALYSHLTAQTLRFLPSFLDTLIVQPTQGQIDSMKNSFATHGLPDLEESILAQYGYQQQSMDSMAAGYAALPDEYYMNANQVPGLFQQAIGYFDSLPIYFPELPGNAKIADLGTNPATLYLNNPSPLLNCWVEFPKDSNITGYQILSAVLNDTIQASYISPTPGDYDHDGIPDIAMQFSTTTLIPMLQPGQRLLSVLGNVVLPTSDTVLYSGAAILTVLEFLRGDANGDGVINVSDIVYLINYLFISGPAPAPLQAGDVNCDGMVNVSDVVYLINYLFISGPPPGC